MQCREVRELLDSYLGEELLVETNHEVLRHLAGCAECRAELDARSRLRSGLKGAFAHSSDLEMRPAFAAEVAARLRAQPAPARRLPYSWLAMAASLLVVVAAGAYVFVGTTAPELARQAAGDHQNCAVKFNLHEKPISLAEAAAKYDPAYARMQRTPPDEIATDAGLLRVAERHSCVFDERRFGHVVLKIDDHLVSVLMTADAVGEQTSAAAEGQLAWLPRAGNLAMASYRIPGHIVFIVSDLADAPFRQVAQQLADPASRLAEIVRNMSAASGD